MYLIFIIKFEHLLNKFFKISRHQSNKSSKITLVFSLFHFCLEAGSDGNAPVIGDPAPSAAEIVEVPGLTVVLLGSGRFDSCSMIQLILLRHYCLIKIPKSNMTFCKQLCSACQVSSPDRLHERLIT